MSNAEIGLKAGEVFEHLKKHGEVPLSTFERELAGGRALIQAAVGWLAREDRIAFRKAGRSTLVGLKPRNT